MKVSVVIPVYNTAPYLKKCLDSVINQTLQGIELICVDDGSTDNSFEVLNGYQKRHHNVFVVKQENQGQSVARNRALELAKGDYIAFVDSDDWIASDFLEKMYNSAIKYGADFVNCLLSFVDVVKNTEKRYGKEFKFTSLHGDEIIVNKLSNKEVNSSPVNKIYLRSFLKKNSINFPEGTINEDILFTTKVAFFATKTSFINEVLYFALVREGSTTRSFSIKNVEASLNILKLEKDFLYKTSAWEGLRHLYKLHFIFLINYMIVQSVLYSGDLKECFRVINSSSYLCYYKATKAKVPLLQKTIVFLYRTRLVHLLRLLPIKCFYAS